MRVLLIAVLTILASGPSLSTELVFGDVTYQPTCNKREWAELEAQLLEAADARQPKEMVALARTYLCGAGMAANRIVQKSMPKLVRHVTSGSGEEDVVERRGRSDFGVRGGEHWKASVTRDGPDIWISGLVNEVCMHSARFRFAASSWLLVEVGDGCD